MKGAKIHGRLVNFERVLKTGDVVQIETSSSPSYGPNRSWLSYAKTTEAKNKIRHWLKNERKDENIPSGRAYVESVLRREGILQREEPEVIQEALTALAIRHRFNSRDDFYAAIGYGGVPTEKAALWIRDEMGKKYEPPSPPVPSEEQIAKNTERLQSAGVIVEGVENCRTKFANCCTPLPGDDIIGFITRGYGVSVHKKDCVNIAHRMHQPKDKERLIKVKWPENTREFYTATIDVVAADRNSLLMDVTTTIGKVQNIRIISSNSRVLKNGNAILAFTLEVPSADQLESLMKKLNKIDDVISVDRTGNKS
jgi:GTP pyrophosphokinase